ncbi:MAG: Holliday junction resolvase RecU, partial [Lachnospiraceae bacterium]|nr:Holliday junction resolvase RecU [Lachnospiraceae bacterium]
ICFDAKECASTSFALSNVHEHQFNFMADFEAQGGISFLLIHFTSVDKYYYMTFFELKKYYEGAQKGEKKSVSVDELRPEFFITEKLGVPLHYLEGVNLDIQERD